MHESGYSHRLLGSGMIVEGEMQELTDTPGNQHEDDGGLEGQPDEQLRPVVPQRSVQDEGVWPPRVRPATLKPRHRIVCRHSVGKEHLHGSTIVSLCAQHFSCIRA